MTPRHFRRLLRRFEAEGDAAAIHALRGRRSNRALPREVRKRALAVALDPLYRDFGPTLLAEHLEIRCERRVSADTLRRWMMEAGLWERPRRRSKHRSRRPRRAALGELAQWDSSVHPWLEDRAEGSQVLISIHDDATSRLMSTRFVERDNGAENRRGDDGVPSAPRPPSRSSPRLVRQGAPAASRRSNKSRRRSRRSGRLPLRPPGTITLGSPTKPIPTQPSLAEPGKPVPPIGSPPLSNPTRQVRRSRPGAGSPWSFAAIPASLASIPFRRW